MGEHFVNEREVYIKLLIYLDQSIHHFVEVGREQSNELFGLCHEKGPGIIQVFCINIILFVF